MRTARYNSEGGTRSIFLCGVISHSNWVSTLERITILLCTYVYVPSTQSVGEGPPCPFRWSSTPHTLWIWRHLSALIIRVLWDFYVALVCMYLPARPSPCQASISTMWGRFKSSRNITENIFETSGLLRLTPQTLQVSISKTSELNREPLRANGILNGKCHLGHRSPFQRRMPRQHTLPSDSSS